MKIRWLFILLLLVAGCKNRPEKIMADLILVHGNVYTMDEELTVTEAFAVKDGKIVELGTSDNILRKFTSKNIIDAEGQYVYPGFIDAHSHFFGLGQSLMTADLRDCRSEDDMIERVQAFAHDKNLTVIRGRGWDQNLWEGHQYPDKEKLDSLFPDVPVFLSRVDGHAALVNQKALDMAGITAGTNVSGGALMVADGKLTGILIDNAVDLVASVLPKPDTGEMKKMILAAQQHCFQYGLTTVSDAGVDKDLIDLYDQMQQEGVLKMRIYAMANPTSPTLDWLLENGPLKTERLNVQSVKYYMDGAMGSRGACLLDDYTDMPVHKGFLLNDPDSLKALAQQLYAQHIQLNVHCIGDSANRVTLKIMADVLNHDSSRRWRIEHVQLISGDDLDYFYGYGIIPSMQPTHATSDAAWVSERTGAERLRYAYALNTLKNSAGLIALGTDFPVEAVNPFYTFYAAIFRKHPVTGKTYSWLEKEKLTRTDALKGMTIWAAYAQFEESEKGSLEPGKFADFIVVDKDLQAGDEQEIISVNVIGTYVNGEQVYKK